MTSATDTALDQWIDQHFDEEVGFLQQLVRVPTDTPPGNNAPHADRTAELIAAWGFDAEKHPVPADEVRAYGMESITNLIVRRRYGDGGRTIALNAHGDVVPPGEGWTHDPYGAEVVAMGLEQLECLVTNPPDDARGAFELAVQHYAYCPALMDNLAPAMGALAATLFGRHWFFDWS